MPTVTFTEEHRAFEVDAGSNLRLVMLRVGVSPYEGVDRLINCRGHNFCGTCAVEIVEGQGASPRTQEEETTLGGSLVVARVVAKNVRLACQTKVTGDMTVKSHPVRPLDAVETKQRIAFAAVALFFGLAFLGTFGYIFLDMIKKF
jgi:ferredoxin